MTTGHWPSSGPGGGRGEAQQSIKRYYQPIREHWMIVVACVVVALLGAGAYVATATKQYSATAELLIQPAPPSDTVLTTLPVIHASGDPTQDVLTGASLVTTNEVAHRIISDLGLDEGPGTVLSSIQANPIGQSSLVSVQATSPSPQQAQRLANAAAKATIEVRTAAMHLAIASILPGEETQAAAEPSAVAGEAGGLDQNVSELKNLARSNDPTLAVASPAELPSGPFSPRTKLALIAALFAGLIVGIGAAFAWTALDPRLQREEQIRDLLAVPILARIPRVRNKGKARPLTPEELPFPALEGYRTLRTILSVRAEGQPRAYLVTGTAPSEGKTTTAMGLSLALAQGGARVILIEADLRRPTVGAALGLRPVYGTEQVLIGEVPLEQALLQVRIDGTPLRVLASARSGVELADRLSFAVARRLIQEAKSKADFVVIDSPPVTTVIDALPLAQFADEIIVVTRIGVSRLNKLVELDELFQAHGTYATGIVLVGADQRRDGYEYYYTDTPPVTGASSRMNGESGSPRRRPVPPVRTD
jgi:capsular exopolysaccharide synthesis family protein